MDDRITYYNSKKTEISNKSSQSLLRGLDKMLYIPVEFNKETLQPHLNQLEEKLYEMTNEVNEKRGLDAKSVYMSINTVYLASYDILPYGISRLDIRLENEKGEIIGSCRLTDISSGKVECRNLKTGESYNLPKDFLTETINISRELFITMYNEWLKNIAHIPDIDSVKIRFTPKPSALRLYVSIDPTRQPSDTNIQTYTYDFYRGEVRYNNGRSRIDVNYDFLVLE
jgi:hypothetical protein